MATKEWQVWQVFPDGMHQGIVTADNAQEAIDKAKAQRVIAPIVEPVMTWQERQQHFWKLRGKDAREKRLTEAFQYGQRGD